MKTANGRRVSMNDVPLGKGRIQSLSDGVFAVALALMGIQLAAPSVPGGRIRFELLGKLSDSAPGFLVFAGAFLATANFWYLQHLTFHFIRHTNRVLIWVNLVFLLFVATLPFCATTLSRFPLDFAAQFMFFGNLLAMGLVLNWHWYYAIHHYMVTPEMDVDVGRRVTTQLRVLPSACALAIPLATIRGDLCYYAFVWVLLLAPIIERWRRPKKETLVRLPLSPEERPRGAKD